MSSLAIFKKTFCATFAFTFCLLLGTPLWGHDWYPPECCHASMDCAPAEVVQVGPRRWYVKNKHGEGYTNENTSIRASEDQHTHACIGPHTKIVFCIFFPGSS